MSVSEIFGQGSEKGGQTNKVELDESDIAIKPDTSLNTAYSRIQRATQRGMFERRYMQEWIRKEKNTGS